MEEKIMSKKIVILGVIDHGKIMEASVHYEPDYEKFLEVAKKEIDNLQKQGMDHSIQLIEEMRDVLKNGGRFYNQEFKGESIFIYVLGNDKDYVVFVPDNKEHLIEYKIYALGALLASVSDEMYHHMMYDLKQYTLQ